MEVHKLTFVGSGSVGKSCIIVRYLQNTFSSVYDPTVEENFRKETEVDGTPCTLEINDTAGQEEFRSIREKYIKVSEIVILVFSIVSRHSFNEVRTLFESIGRMRGIRIATLVVANKIDLAEDRLVTREEAEELVKNNKSTYIESSAKTGDGVSVIFDEAVRVLRKFKAEAPKVQEAPKEAPKNEGGCCVLF